MVAAIGEMQMGLRVRLAALKTGEALQRTVGKTTGLIIQRTGLPDEPYLFLVGTVGHDQPDTADTMTLPALLDTLKEMEDQLNRHGLIGGVFGAISLTGADDWTPVADDRRRARA